MVIGGVTSNIAEWVLNCVGCLCTVNLNRQIFLKGLIVQTNFSETFEI